jgi:hypothetical protein
MQMRRQFLIALITALCVFALGGAALIFVSDRIPAPYIAPIEIVD